MFDNVFALPTTFCVWRVWVGVCVCVFSNCRQIVRGIRVAIEQYHNFNCSFCTDYRNFLQSLNRSKVLLNVSELFNGKKISKNHTKKKINKRIQLCLSFEMKWQFVNKRKWDRILAKILHGFYVRK